MKAVIIRDRALVIEERPDPVPGLGQLLISVRSAGVNNADLMQKEGNYPAPPDSPADIPGLELAGEVVGVGPGVQRFTVGERVMALVGGGAQAELIAVHESSCLKVPDTTEWAQAGGFCEAFATAHDALFTQCGLQMGERVLITGAAGGVGTAAVQIAVATGAHVVASVRNPDRRIDVERLGATVIAPEDHRDNGPYDVILELFPKSNLGDDVRCLASEGRIHLLSLVGGPVAELNVAKLMAARGTIHASTLRARSLAAKADVMRRVESHVLPLFALENVHVPILASYPLDQANTAYEAFATGGKFGKIVLVN